ncbi:hypothetical protein EV663_12812, partial [Rhodovulum bhavnagarense]
LYEQAVIRDVPVLGEDKTLDLSFDKPFEVAEVTISFPGGVPPLTIQPMPGLDADALPGLPLDHGADVPAPAGVIETEESGEDSLKGQAGQDDELAGGTGLWGKAAIRAPEAASSPGKIAAADLLFGGQGGGLFFGVQGQDGQVTDTFGGAELIADFNAAGNGLPPAADLSGAEEHLWSFMDRVAALWKNDAPLHLAEGGNPTLPQDDPDEVEINIWEREDDF